MKVSNPTSMVTPVPEEKSWFVVDATDQTLGRVASRIASVLRGKHKTTFAPQWDMGDFVVVINAEKVHLTGRKWQQKQYYRHSGYPGGLRSRTAEEVRERQPEFLIENAVKGMLPKNRLGRKMIKKLKVYSGAEHPHAAQNPQVMSWE